MIFQIWQHLIIKKSLLFQMLTIIISNLLNTQWPNGPLIMWLVINRSVNKYKNSEHRVLNQYLISPKKKKKSISNTKLNPSSSSQIKQIQPVDYAIAYFLLWEHFGGYIKQTQNLKEKEKIIIFFF